MSIKLISTFYKYEILLYHQIKTLVLGRKKLSYFPVDILVEESDPCEGSALQTRKLLERYIDTPHPQRVYKP